MKAFIFLLVILVFTYVKAASKEDECNKDGKIDEKEVARFLKDTLSYDPSIEFKCHIRCLLNREGLWKDGGLNTDATKRYVEGDPYYHDSHRQMAAIIDECSSRKDEDECVTAYLITKCLVEKRREYKSQ